MAKKRPDELNGTLGSYTPNMTAGAQQVIGQASQALQPVDWNAQMQSMWKQIQNRPAFQYNVNNDALYQNLKDQYVHQGQRAMMDTMGQAAGLTGGYNSSYGQAVGNQAYNEHLLKLNEQIPALYDRARQAYDAEGQDLYNRYNLAAQGAAMQYDRERDALADQRYEQEWNYNVEQDRLNRERQERLDAADQAYRDWQMGRAGAEDAREIALMMIQMGKMPGDDLLASAGISPADAKAMSSYYAAQMAAQMAASGGGGRSGSRSGSGRSSGGGSDSGSTTGDQAQYNPLTGGIVGAAAGVAGAQTAAQSNITDSDRSKLFEYGRANGPQALADYMEKNFKNAPNYWAVRKWLQEELSNYQRARSGGSGGKNLDAIM